MTFTNTVKANVEIARLNKELASVTNDRDALKIEASKTPAVLIQNTSVKETITDKAILANQAKQTAHAVQQYNAIMALNKPKANADDAVHSEPSIKVATANPYFVTQHGYYLAMDSGHVLLLKPAVDGVSLERLPVVLRKPLDGQGAKGANAITQTIQAQDGYKGWTRPQGADLSQADLDSIIKGKPSLENLLNVYDQYSQDEVALNISKAIPVW